MPVATDLEEPVFEFEDLVQDDLHRSSGGEECTSYCLSDKLIAIGFESGYIKVIDYNGDTVSPCILHFLTVVALFSFVCETTQNVHDADLDL